MEKPVAAIEFGSKKIKLVIGYELGGQVYILYALTKPYGSAIDGGEIIDPTIVSQTVRELRDFSVPSAKLRLTISEAILALPPKDLEVLQTQQITTVISQESKIASLEIKNIYSLVRNAFAGLDSQLVDIVPEIYVLDQGRTFTNVPLGEISSALTLIGKVHTLPRDFVEKYTTVLNEGNMNVKKYCISSLGATALLNSYSDTPKDYIICDIGATNTIISLVGNKQLFASRSFPWGSDHITERIIESFNINEIDAEKYKTTYGIDNREMLFKTTVCSTLDGEGKTIKHYVSELNEIIKKELDVFVAKLNEELELLVSEQNPSFKSLPMILVGGGSCLNGLIPYISPKLPCGEIKLVIPRTLGARDATYTNCLGMILAFANSPHVVDNSQPKVGTLTREK